MPPGRPTTTLLGVRRDTYMQTDMQGDSGQGAGARPAGGRGPGRTRRGAGGRL